MSDKTHTVCDTLSRDEKVANEAEYFRAIISSMRPQVILSTSSHCQCNDHFAQNSDVFIFPGDEFTFPSESYSKDAGITQTKQIDVTLGRVMFVKDKSYSSYSNSMADNKGDEELTNKITDANDEFFGQMPPLEDETGIMYEID